MGTAWFLFSELNFAVFKHSGKNLIMLHSCRGTFDILVKSDGTTRTVGSYDNRGSFGELALMYNTPRAATIVATSPGALWCLVSDIMI